MEPDIDEELSSQTFDDLPIFTFDGKTVRAKVVDVHDGDTVTIVFRFRGEFVKHHLRMLGYDSPEVRPTLVTPDRDLHMIAAGSAKRYLEFLVLNKLVWVVFSREEKYGRLMGKIYASHSHTFASCQSIGDSDCVNDAMIFMGYGKRYDGKKKKDGFSRLELEGIISRALKI